MCNDHVHKTDIQKDVPSQKTLNKQGLVQSQAKDHLYCLDVTRCTACDRNAEQVTHALQ